jgi:hypothetical protein
MVVHPPGIAFEKAVAQVQAQFDSAATVTHNETIVDRLGQARQFDVVIRGKFAGQSLLGVIECKDYRRPVGTPQVDAFVTKSADVNANLKMLISRRGFSAPAIEKCAHYGIQPLSLLGHDTPKVRLFLGTRWEAERVSWGRVSVTLRFATEPKTPVSFKAERITIGGKRVLDWFTNYLLDHEDQIEGYGWVVGIAVEFNSPQLVQFEPDVVHYCVGIDFQAERLLERFERVVAVSGTGFYDWHTKTASFPPGANIQYDPVPMDFEQWTRVSEASTAPPGFMNIKLLTRSLQFERVPDAIDLEPL